MISVITSSIAGILIIVYLGYYAMRLNQIPLWIVIIAVLAMAITDFVLMAKDAARQERDKLRDEV